MNEAQILAQALSSLIQYLGGTPVLLFLALVIVGPMITVVWIVYKLDRIQGKTTTEQEARMTSVFKRQDDRFEQVVQMYRDNISLVKSYEAHVTNQRETNDKLIDLVAVSTDTQATMVAYIKNNLFCPLVKQRTRPDKINGEMS
jgi:hypothetical protein